MSTCTVNPVANRCSGIQYVEGIGCLIYEPKCLAECSVECKKVKNEDCYIRILRYPYRARKAICAGPLSKSYYISLMVVICLGVVSMGLTIGICCGWKKSVYHKRRQQRLAKKNEEDVISVVEVPSELILDSSKPGTPNINSVDTPVVAMKSILQTKY